MNNPPINKIIGPHRGQPVLMAGEQLEQARAAMIMMHGRGASARDILGLSNELQQPGFVYIAPRQQEVPGIQPASWPHLTAMSPSSHRRYRSLRNCSIVWQRQGSRLNALSC
ncbi:hypothetical protein [Dictyobacter kobayashii]|uniref:Phospholipase/carboxylesterase/thioesterase domain-containing protein n=1 Tax=Dictyobacter kobayashii TaxID=2014872 RepID=A0A402AU14_9CHLR|nr:hypothetical protein [Dictyobacter kobayashii]GCE22602.1 hypothetical protein KDK_64020 [Dictyobacter kobayashii]